jgi:hydroxyacylglutathione hydrolase
LCERAGATAYLSGEGGPEWSYAWPAKKPGGGAYPHQILRDGDEFEVGKVRMRAVHTPGHTPEHLSYLITDEGSGATEPMGIISGDFVFVGDVGRPDLLETAVGVRGSAERAARALHASVQRFRTLPEHLQVWPAHGAGSACGKALGAVPQSTVGYENRFNPALLAASDPLRFVEHVLEGQVDPPLYFARMKRENREGPRVLGSLPRPTPLAGRDLASAAASTVVFDTRPWTQFRQGALPGSIWSPVNNTFCTVAGSFIGPAEAIGLIIDPAQVEEAARCLVRIGLDDVRWWAAPAALAEHAAFGGTLAPTPETPITGDWGRDSGVLVLDVRNHGEHAQGHIPGSTNIAHTRLAGRLDDLPRDRPIAVHCQGGTRSAQAVTLLRRHGFNAFNLGGGFAAWARGGGETAQRREMAST